ncbi:MAG: SLBB domain-containing protein [Elusimicrobiota bacterium]|nr:SLBB domain-containing protein [Elusimicrobiota bacterium]
MNIVELVKSAGVVGAGGGGFPTHVKLQSKVDTVIANGAECEPLLRCDQQMMSIYAQKIIRGLKIAMESTGASKGIIALKEKYHNAAQSLKKTIEHLNSKTIELFFLDNFYPAGDEFVLVYEVTKRILPEGGLPLQVGVVVDNVVTLMNVADAIDGKPVTERPLTVCGAVKNPLTRFFPVGTEIKKVIEFAGGSTVPEYEIIDGGPMMGNVVKENDVVTKKTSGILVLPSDHRVGVGKKCNLSFILKQLKSACEQCQDCTEICPRYLLGHNFQAHKIQRAVGSFGLTEDEVISLTNAFLCSECGLCEWVCPMMLLPRRINQEVKKQLIKRGVKNPHKNTPSKLHEMRHYRSVPLEHILSRLDLLTYDKPAPFTDRSIEISEVKIPLLQHTGLPAIPIVKVGDKVKKGDLIGKIPEGQLGANIHASIDGVVTKVNEYIKIKR